MSASDTKKVHQGAAIRFVPSPEHYILIFVGCLHKKDIFSDGATVFSSLQGGLIFYSTFIHRKDNNFFIDMHAYKMCSFQLCPR